MAKDIVRNSEKVAHASCCQAAPTTYPFISVGDSVVVLCHDEGYHGMTGIVKAVFASGRCLVAVGEIALLNVPPEGLEHAMPTL